jgi:hypothetical protein
MKIEASESDNVAKGKSMSTKATLSLNGLLTIETKSRSSLKTQGLKGHVVVVVYDASGNAIWLSNEHKCTTRGGTWDPTCASSGTDSWFEQFPAEVGQYAASLDIVHDDEGLGRMVQIFRNAIKTSQTIAPEIKAAMEQWEK